MLENIELPNNLISLIKVKEEIEYKIGHLLEKELDIVRKENYGNGHYIDDICINNDNTITIIVWYDDWERSQRASHTFENTY